MKFKVGDKVSARINCNTCEGVVVYLNEKDSHKPCLAVFKDTAGDDFSRWLNHHDMEIIPKFKVGEVWEMRDGDEGEIISMSSRDMIVIYSKNTNLHSVIRLDLDGRYCEHNGDSDFDLMRLVG